jgi:multiple sugar transport system permease protein
LPTLAIFAAVRLYPIGETLRLSLHKWDILSKNKPFIGLQNFQELLGDRLFHEALINTTIIAFGVLIVTIPLAMVLAALIYHRTRSRFAGFYETAIFLPHVVSLVPAAMAWKWIFDARLGPLNAFLIWLGMEPKAWLFDPALSLVCVIVLCSWQALGYAVLIYLVGFKSLPVSLFEAAKLDGASGPESFWHISIPMLKPITLYVSVVTLVSGFNVYAQAFVLASDAQGAPGRQVRVLVLDMLENSFRNYRVGYAASEAVVLLVIVLVLTLIQFTLLRERGRK